MSSNASVSTAAVKTDASFDENFDIVVVGSGAAGLATSLFAAWQGNRVLLLEKASELGGTTKKAAFWYWVPNNKPMQALGIEDRKEDCMRYMARLSRPESYSPDKPLLGLTAWEYEMCAAVYDYASVATELLAERGALEYRHCPDVPDYWAELAEDKAPKGRVLLPKGACESMSDGGAVAVRTMAEAAERAGVDIRRESRVEGLVTDDAGSVIGVRVNMAQRGSVRVKASKAVVFGSGGFTHNVEMRRHHLPLPVFGGCAAQSNEGDFVPIAASAGAELRNMGDAWMCPIVLEKALNKDPSLIGTFSPSGDSMIYVNKLGKRVTNEKLAYNESARVFFEWDATRSEYPNLVLIAVWDERSQRHSASTEYGRFIAPEGEGDAHVIKGATFAQLAANLRRRVEDLSPQIGNMKLADDFEQNLSASVARFNEFAVSGVDQDFRRGERAVELLFNGPALADPCGPNPTMYPITDRGPYYAALLTGGNLDTKGGPLTNSDGQVLDRTGRIIQGLYGVGNCVASASGRSYWAGGATLGPILAFAYLAARSANRQTPRL